MVILVLLLRVLPQIHVRNEYWLIHEYVILPRRYVESSSRYMWDVIIDASVPMSATNHSASAPIGRQFQE